MNRSVRGLISCLLCLSLLLAACGDRTSTPEGGDAPAVQGRYVETAVPLPEGIESALTILPGADGSIELYTIDETGVALYRYADGAFAKEETPWLQRIGESPLNLSQIVLGGDGRRYVLMEDYEGVNTTGFWSDEDEDEEGSGEAPRFPVPHLFRVREDGSDIEEIAFEQPPEDGYCGDVAVLADGSFLLGMGDTLHYGPDGALIRSLPSSGMGLAATDKLAAFASYTDRLSVTLVDLSTGEELGSSPTGSMSSSHVKLATDGAGNLFYCNSDGIFRNQESGEWERLMDGALYSMSSAALRPQTLLPREDGSFYVLYYSDNGNELKRYDWSDTAVSPTKTLHISSLYDSGIARQAALELQKVNPDVKVELEVLMPEDEDESGITVGDAVKRLNTELLAGDGADIYLLDGMPLRSYIQKGVLTDLTEIAKPQIESGAWIPNIAGALSSENGIYAIPAQFRVPTIWGSKELVNSVNSLEYLADWSQAHTELPLFYHMNPRYILNRLYPLCAPSWTSEEGGIKEGEFAEFLNLLGRIVESFPQEDSDFHTTSGDGFDTPGLYKGLNQVIVDNISMMDTLAVNYTAVNKNGSGGFTSFDGAAKGTFIPLTLCGVNARSSLPDEALEYVKMLMSEPIQSVDYRDFSGLPVNSASFKKLLTRGGDTEPYGMTMGYGMEGGTVLIKVEEWAPQELQDQFLSLVQSVNTPALSDPLLMEMIQEESAAFFRGERDAAATASAVASRTKAYLAQ